MKKVIDHRDFVRDLSRGHIGEDIAEAFLAKEFKVICDNVSQKNPDFDFIVRGIDSKHLKKQEFSERKLLRKIFKEKFGFIKKKLLTVEVKFDEAAARYGNFFIEIFFDIERGIPGTTFKCKADIVLWVVPARKKFKIYLFRRADFLAWLFNYVFNSKCKLKFKTPAISPKARGIAVPIKLAVKSPACIGEYEFKL